MGYGINMRALPYVHNSDQMQDFLGTNHSQDYNQATKNLQYTIQEIEVYYDGGWKVDLNNGADAINITEGWYDPPWTARTFALAADDGATTMQIIYDKPGSEKVIFPWATGVYHPSQITRLWTGDSAMTQGKIILAR